MKVKLGKFDKDCVEIVLCSKTCCDNFLGCGLSCKKLKAFFKSYKNNKYAKIKYGLLGTCLGLGSFSTFCII